MTVNRVSGATVICVVGLSVALPCAAWAQGSQTEPGGLAGDRDSLTGDHVRLRTNAYGFKNLSAKPSADKASTDKPSCAPQGAALRVLTEVNGTLTVQFYDIPNEPRGFFGTPEVTKEALEACKPEERVNTHSSYQISRTALEGFGFRRTGVTFGGLVIPFKYRLGGDKGITSSSTVAPYVGFRTRYLQGYGVSFTPILSAGLGLVPVTDPTEGKTETKPAFSMAIGLVMTSSKNDQFNAGLVFGRDLLSKSDRTLDPNVDKPWLSFYLGVAMQ